MHVKTHFDSDLRRRADDPDILRQALAKEPVTVEAMRRLVAEDPSELNLSHLGREASRLADHLLLAGKPDEALPLKEEAVEIWRRLGRRKAEFLARLRAAEIVFELGRREQALEALGELLGEAQAPPVDIYRDFVLEARGRLLARRGMPEEARRDLQKALELRRERGSQKQVEETEQLLEALNE